MIISIIEFVTSTNITQMEINSFLDLPRTNRLKNDNPPLWSPYDLKGRRITSTDEIDIYALIIDWDHDILPAIDYKHFRHKTHSGRWRIILPFDKSLKLAAQDFSLFYDEIMDKIGLRADDKTLGIMGYDLSGKSLSQFFYYPHESVKIEERDGEQLTSTVFLTKTSKIRRLWRKDFFPKLEKEGIGDKYHKKILALHRGYKDSCDFSELRLSRDHCWFEKEQVGELDLNTFESSNKSFGANIHCYHANCFSKNKQFILERCLINESDNITETSAYLMRGLLERFWDWNFIEEMYLPKVLKPKHHLLTKLNIHYPENDSKLLTSILYDDKIIFNPDDGLFYLFTGKKYEAIRSQDLGDRFNNRLFKWYRYLGYGKKNMKEWIVQFESSIRDKKREELKMKEGLALRNGVLTFDSVTGEHTLHPNDGSYFIRDYKDYDYDPMAECPRWIQALNEWFDYKPKYIDLLQEYMGYCLTDWRRYEKFLVMYNKSGAGKNTIANVLLQLTSSSTCELSKLNKETICADKAHFKMLFCDEKVSSIQGSVLDLLKNLVTTSPVHCRALYGSSYASEIFPKLLLAFNEVPKAFQVDEALERRLLVINFKKKFSDRSSVNRNSEGLVKEPDINLGEKLKKELPGILNWALIGLQRLCVMGRFSVDEISNDQLTQKAKSNEPTYYDFYQFIDNMDEQKVNAAELYRSYNQSVSKRDRITSTRFGMLCSEMKDHLIKTRASTGVFYERTDFKGLDEFLNVFDI